MDETEDVEESEDVETPLKKCSFKKPSGGSVLTSSAAANSENPQENERTLEKSYLHHYIPPITNKSKFLQQTKQRVDLNINQLAMIKESYVF